VVNQLCILEYFCLLIGLRNLTTGDIFLHEIWPSLSWTSLVKMEYLTFYLGIAVFFSFIQLQFPDEVKSWAAKIVTAISALFTLLVLFTPVYTFSLSLNYFQPFSLLALLYLIYGLGLAFIRGVRRLGHGPHWLYCHRSNLY